MREKEVSTRVLFIRHGQPDYDSDRIYDDRKLQIGLTTQGERQAQRTAECLASQDFVSIYTSPILRTHQTATYLADVTGQSLTTDHRLQERDFGQWNGLSFKEIEQQYPEQYRQWKQNKLEYTPEGGESMQQVSDRLLSFLAEVLPKHKGEQIAVFSHVGPIRLAITLAFQIPMQQYRQFQVDYAAICRIDYGQTLNNLIYMNKVCY